VAKDSITGEVALVGYDPGPIGFDPMPAGYDPGPIGYDPGPIGANWVEIGFELNEDSEDNQLLAVFEVQHFTTYQVVLVGTPCATGVDENGRCLDAGSAQACITDSDCNEGSYCPQQSNATCTPCACPATGAECVIEACSATCAESCSGENCPGECNTEWQICVPQADSADIVGTCEVNCPEELTIPSNGMVNCGLDETITSTQAKEYTKLECADGSTGQQIETLVGLQCFSGLVTLQIPNHNVSDLSPVKGCVEMIDLWIEGNGITDIASLSKMTQLTRLRMSNNAVESLLPLQDLSILRVLRAADNQISDISPLSELTTLDTLILRGNNITDLSPLLANAGLEPGDEVDVRNNNIACADYTVAELLDRGVAVDWREGCVCTPEAAETTNNELEGATEIPFAPTASSGEQVTYSSEPASLCKGMQPDYYKFTITEDSQLVTITVGTLFGDPVTMALKKLTVAGASEYGILCAPNEGGGDNCITYDQPSNQLTGVIEPGTYVLYVDRVSTDVIVPEYTVQITLNP
jgi:hypothetical protein